MSKLLMLTASLLFVGVTAQATDIGMMPTEKEVVVGVNDALFTSPMDTQHDITAVASGLFPNGCYRWKRFDVQHQIDKNIHSVRAIAGVTQGMCIMVLVPFSKEVNLGRLDAGNHTVRFYNADETYMEKQITIR